MPPEPVTITIDGTLNFGTYVFPAIPPGTDFPPPTSLIDFSCEDENALMEAWFTILSDNSGIAPLGAIVKSAYKSHPFIGLLESMGYSETNIKLVIRNTGTANGFWVMTATF